jgi:hypothetical protein
MNASRTHADPKPGPATSAYRQLVMKGLEPREAANIVAVMAGIPIVGQPWTLREVNHLVFLRKLRSAGHWDTPDRAGRPGAVSDLLLQAG